MAKKSNMGGLIGSLGGWAFLVGVILAVILGVLGPVSGTWLIVLVVIGLVIGLLNVTGREVKPFLLSGVVLIIASALGQNVMADVQILDNILQALLAIFVPATVIVAIKNVFTLARS
ncbi:hypothetical protein COU56_02320 [Candidatus Pacearchaeota archaeon CG10_big_fil_rev_8_21_14_0_10_31_9]|nr:MAG: hypothetical protein AUJ62_03030 [Candidatus Pacearchaeota archaeon CG1_02_32_21]PIN94910.1 MAG: hypothetical protein COU56_02320 [Candidatus Pacearchaeota archaeon CG10_big_fil_rev_8_21_14_0_10_31_9]PIZ82747.1 MAG: hypothetical protein COX97_03275 [Candidatus Pacearchaeota archaeon CG_4_10_14_0_2_um_filter_05_32_18]